MLFRLSTGLGFVPYTAPLVVESRSHNEDENDNDNDNDNADDANLD